MRRFPAWLLLVAAAMLALPAAAQDAQGKGKGKGKGKDTPPSGQPTVTISSGESPLGPSTWKPGYDYTHLPPTNETLWAQLVKDGVDGVDMEEAIGLVAEVLGGPVWPKHVWMDEYEGRPAWRLELFASGGENEGPRRIDFVIDSFEPKVLERVDLPSLPEQDRSVWNGLAKATVQAEALITLCKTNMRGDRSEPQVTEARARWIQFVDEKPPYWKCEMMGMEGEIPRRYGLEAKSERAMVRQKLLLDRFPGTPLRRAQPLELPTGIFLHDFIVGDGPSVTRESKVSVQYRLFLLDNTKLHDTWARNLPETFLVTQAPLKGMTEGLIGMRVGGKRKIAMPFELAFGEAGNATVPPKAMVICDVSVVDLPSQ